MEAIENSVKTILKGRFEAGEITFICDIVQVVGDMEPDLYEIKSSTTTKPEHNEDLAFLIVVLRQRGFHIRNIAVIHINNQYVRQGDIVPEELTTATYVTEAVKELREYTIQKIAEALKTMKLPEGPDTSPLKAGKSAFKEWLDIYKYMKRTKPSSTYNLCQINAITLSNLRNKNIEYIKDIPIDFALQTRQALQVQSAKIGGPGIDAKKINKYLDKFKFPLYFFDYETSGV